MRKRTSQSRVINPAAGFGNIDNAIRNRARAVIQSHPITIAAAIGHELLQRRLIIIACANVRREQQLLGKFFRREIHRAAGEISGLKIVQPSGDASYDESVLRAVKKSSPLSAPPENYRRDFADVELAFRPQDLGA